MSTPYYNCNTNHGTQPQPVVVQGYAVDTSKTNGTVAAYEPPGRVPLHLEPYSQLPERQERETDAKFRDVAWALLFYLHLGVVAYLTAVNVPTMANIMGAGYAADGNNNQAQEEDDRRHLQDNDNNNQGWNNYNYNNNNNYDNISVNLPATLSMVALLGLSGLVLSTLALGFLIVAAETLIKVGIVASIIMCLLGGLLSLVAGQLMGAVVGLGMTAMLAWYACGGKTSVGSLFLEMEWNPWLPLYIIFVLDLHKSPVLFFAFIKFGPASPLPPVTWSRPPRRFEKI